MGHEHHHSHKHKHGHHHNREGDGGHHHQHRSHHHESSHKDHKPSNTRVRYACKQGHRDCAGENTWSSTGEIAGPGGNRMTVSWKPCRAEEARIYIENLSAGSPEQPHDAGQAGGSREAGPPPQTPAQTQQAPPPPQEPQGEAPAGPGLTQAPAAAEATQQPVPQQEANASGGGNTVPGPTAPPLGQTSMSFEDYARATRYYQPTPYAGQYGGQSSAGEYGGGYDMPFPEDVPNDENMPFDEYYGGGEDSFSGMPMGGGGGRRAPSTVAAPVEARSEWVATSPENLYHSHETDGVVKDQPYTALPPIWGQTHYSNL